LLPVPNFFDEEAREEKREWGSGGAGERGSGGAEEQFS